MEKPQNEKTVTRGWKTREIIGLVACILIGITLLMSGSGKLFVPGGDVPGQTIDFIGQVMAKAHFIPDAWKLSIIPVLYDVIIPYVLPAVELILGLLLLVGFAPRLVAAIFVPLTFLFMGNNLYSISIGMDKIPSCSCFGIWESIFHTTLTPAQSLVYDIVLFILALVIIFVIPGKFLWSRKWLRNLGQKKDKTATGKGKGL
jgi:uncharacterized membrane protein YphA (DoxX/SURF4 family)